MKKLIAALLRLLGMPACRDVVALPIREPGFRVPGMARFHLFVCRDCECFHQQLELTSRAVARLPQPAAPEELKRDLIARLQRRK